MSVRIPCTVQILTRNNAPHLRSCLDSLKMFDEVIVHDGYSTDGTREIAQNYDNVRLMDQNKAYLDAENRITDFASMRNESLQAAKYDWIFMVDGDEEVAAELIAEVKEIVEANEPGVFDVFRRFYIDGEPVIHCAGYPALQVRLFHRSLTQGFVKNVHERLNLQPGVQKKMLQTELKTPLPPASQLKPKYDRYLAMEVKRQGVMSWGDWTKWILVRNLRSVIGLSLRILWIWIIPRKGKKMPLSHEFAYIRQSLRTIAHTFPPHVRSLQARHLL
jgi:glycosyltransferase involved in cell wall biosynthesis